MKFDGIKDNRRSDAQLRRFSFGGSVSKRKPRPGSGGGLYTSPDCMFSSECRIVALNTRA